MKESAIRKFLIHELKWAFVTITWCFIYVLGFLLLYWAYNLVQCKSNAECMDTFIAIGYLCTCGMFYAILAFLIALLGRIALYPFFYLYSKLKKQSTNDLSVKNDTTVIGSDFDNLFIKAKSFCINQRSYLAGATFSLITLTFLVVNQKHNLGLQTIEVNYFSFPIFLLRAVVKFPFNIILLIAVSPALLIYLLILNLPFLLAYLTRKWPWVSVILFTLACFVFFASCFWVWVFMNQATRWL